MMRLFTAIGLPPAVAQQLALLRGGFIGARWVEPEDYHITLRFLGEVEGRLAREADDGLRALDVAPFSLAFSEYAFFGGARPHALVALVAPNPALARLQGRHESALRRLGFKPETRKYTPHVTLAWLRGVTPEAAAAFLQHAPAPPHGAFAATCAGLYSSAPQGGGPYRLEAAYPFSGRD
jgi:2'-5' RNA ligase